MPALHMIVGDRSRSLASLVKVQLQGIITISRIVAIAENIRSLQLSRSLRTEFHIIAGIVKIAGNTRSLYCDFHMIAEIAAITALVVSLKSFRSLTIVHGRPEYYDRRDRL